MKPIENIPRKTEPSFMRKIYYRVSYYPRFFLFIMVRLFYVFCYTYGIWELPVPKKTIMNLSDEYVEKWTKRFLDSYQLTTTDTSDNCSSHPVDFSGSCSRDAKENVNYNSNIDECFYDKQSYKLAVES